MHNRTKVLMDVKNYKFKAPFIYENKNRYIGKFEFDW
jgi:hypothetical protein